MRMSFFSVPEKGVKPRGERVFSFDRPLHRTSARTVGSERRRRGRRIWRTIRGRRGRWTTWLKWRSKLLIDHLKTNRLIECWKFVFVKNYKRQFSTIVIFKSQMCLVSYFSILKPHINLRDYFLNHFCQVFQHLFYHFIYCKI